MKLPLLCYGIKTNSFTILIELFYITNYKRFTRLIVALSRKVDESVIKKLT